jgi:hypothetical protein
MSAVRCINRRQVKSYHLRRLARQRRAWARDFRLARFGRVIYNGKCNSNVSVAFERPNSLHGDVVGKSDAAPFVFDA